MWKYIYENSNEGESGFGTKKVQTQSQWKYVARSTCSSGNCSFQLKWILQAVLRPGQVSDEGRPPNCTKLQKYRNTKVQRYRSLLDCTALHLSVKLFWSPAVCWTVWNHVGVLTAQGSVFLKGCCCLRRSEWGKDERRCHLLHLFPDIFQFTFHKGVNPQG